MGSSPVSDTLQRRALKILMEVKLKAHKACIKDMLAASVQTFEGHLECLDEIMKRLKEVGLQVNISKSGMCQKGEERLSFWVTAEGHKPLASRVQGMLELLLPRNNKEVWMFAGIINFVKNHVPRRAALVEPNTSLTKDSVSFNWQQG